MALTPFAASTKDNANSALASGISASSISIPLNSGGGASFPQPYSGTASSGGTATALNSTGISAIIGGSAAVGKFIWNRTDNSVAVITAVATNALTTTALLGPSGCDLTWENADAWSIDPFILTLEKHDSASPYNVTQREEILITGRSTDTLTAASSADRGYNGTTAATFASSDYAYLHVTSPIIERFKDIASVLAVQLDTNTSNISTNNTSATSRLGALETGSYPFVTTTGSANAYVAASPALASYAAGNYIEFKASFTNTGSSTLNVNGLGAKTIKKNDGATNLAANDIISGQVVTVLYDGTNFQMLSPIGTPATITTTVKTVYASGADSGTLANPTSETNFDTHTYTVQANDLVAGVAYPFRVPFHMVAGGSYTHTFAVRLGSTDIASCSLTSTTNDGYVHGYIVGTAAAGASASVRGVIFMNVNTTLGFSLGAANVATNGSLVMQFSYAFGTTSGSNTVLLKGAIIEKMSSSTFT